jgi:NTE family protein
LALLLAQGCAEMPPRTLVPDLEPGRDLQRQQRYRLAIVLSSGSARAFAHVGVLQALEAHGVHPDLVVGTSAGALVGVLYASGMSAERISQARTEGLFDLFVDRTRAGGSRGARLEEFVARQVREERIERLPIRFAAIATDLSSGCLEVFDTGDPARAVHASASVPVFFAPVSINGRQFIDGSMVSPLPVRVARALGAERIVAIDVSYNSDWSPPEDTVESIFYTAQLMVRNLARVDLAEADVAIRPDLPPWQDIESGDYAAVVAAGYRAAIDALPRIRNLLARPAAAATRLASGRPDPRWCDASVR